MNRWIVGSRVTFGRLVAAVAGRCHVIRNTEAVPEVGIAMQSRATRVPPTTDGSSFSKRRARSVVLAILAALLLFVTSTSAASASPGAATTSSTAKAPSVATTVSSCDPVTGFEPGDFSSPTRIDNKWSPLVPGTQAVFEGIANRGGGPLPHRVVHTVTDLTKVINGVRTVVILDTDINEGQLVEVELAFHAQDDAGNVWNLGEYPEEYENGQFLGAPSTWIAGLAGAEAGVLMLSDPQLGTPRYLQGVAPDIAFLDCAKVAKTGRSICVPANCYADVLVTNETSPLDQGGGHQIKYYAPGVGNIQVDAVGDPEGETLVLVSIVELGPNDVARARRQALELERRAYQISDVYQQTPPAQ